MGTYDTSEAYEILGDSTQSLLKFKGNSDKDKITIVLNTDKNKLESFFYHVNAFSSYIDVKESYYLLAIRNILKKNNYLSLMLQLAQEQISEDEYVKEIEDNPSKYILDIKYLDDPNDLKIINELVKKIGLSFSIDQVAEIFSLDSDDLEKKVLKINS